MRHLVLGVVVIALLAGCSKRARSVEVGAGGPTRDVDAMTPPASTPPRDVTLAEIPNTVLAALSPGLELVISRTSITIAGAPVAGLTGGAIRPEALRIEAGSPVIGDLATELANHRARLDQIAKAAPELPEVDLTLVMDRDTPHQVLGVVLMTAAQAGFKRVRFVVQAHGVSGLLQGQLPVTAVGGPPIAATQASVVVTTAGFGILSGELETKIAGHDVDALRARMAALAGVTLVSLRADADVKLQELAGALAAITRNADGTPLHAVQLGLQ
jgi:biopolymer transport protein ExbD